MSDSGSSKAVSVIALALALVAAIVALAAATRKSPAPQAAPAGIAARLDSLEEQLDQMRERVGKQAVPAKPAVEPARKDGESAKLVMLDAALRDQEIVVAELQAKVKNLEAAAKRPAPAPVVGTKPAAAPSPVATTRLPDDKVLRAQRVEIIDADGKVRGVIQVGDNGAPAINFLDADGKVRSEYMLTPAGNTRLLFSEKDGRRYSLLPILSETK